MVLWAAVPWETTPIQVISTKLVGIKVLLAGVGGWERGVEVCLKGDVSKKIPLLIKISLIHKLDPVYYNGSEYCHITEICSDKWYVNAYVCWVAGKTFKGLLFESSLS